MQIRETRAKGWRGKESLDITHEEKGLESVEHGSKEADGKKGKERPLKSCLGLPSAGYKHVQQIFNFAGSWGLANDTIEFGKHG